MISGRNKLISEYSYSDWLWAFWNTNMINPDLHFYNAYPICFQFWFMRDLIVVILFSPLVYFLVKIVRQYIVILLGILWVFNWWFSIVGFSIVSLFFFSSGAYFSIHKKDFIKCMKPFLSIAAILYPIIIVIELYFETNLILHRINILIGIILAITLSAHYIEEGKWKVNTFLSDSNFFIYAYHGFILASTIKLLVKIIQPHSSEMLLILYFGCPTIIILVGLLLYYVMRKYLPKTTSLITGGR